MPQLKQLILIWRHGDRSPVRDYPNYEKDYGDTFDNLWKQGPGQLTVHGMHQHYELGSFLKSRYPNFIPDTYNLKDMYIKSTDVDRTLMSAYSNVMGMYQNPNNTDTRSNNDPLDPKIGNFSIFDKFLPIPVHTVSKDVDYVLRTPNRGTTCPIYGKFEKLIRQSKKLNEISEAHTELWEKIHKHGGFKGTVGILILAKTSEPTIYPRGEGCARGFLMDNICARILRWPK